MNFAITILLQIYFFKGSVLLKMTKEDFQSSYPHHGQKFYDAFNEFVQQVQQQQQHQHSPSSMDGNTNDLLGLQSTHPFQNYYIINID